MGFIPAYRLLSTVDVESKVRNPEIAGEMSVHTYFNIMDQYHPCHKTLIIPLEPQRPLEKVPESTGICYNSRHKKN